MEGNKELVRAFYGEVINNGNGELMYKIVAADFVDHYAAPESATGIEGLKVLLRMVATAFPDIQVKIEELIAEGDLVTARVTVTGTHTGTLMGKIPPSGKTASWTGIDIIKIKGGVITERWSQRDLLGMMRQIGAIN